MRLTDYKWFQAEPLVADSFLPNLVVRRLGLQDYDPIWGAMRYLVENPKEKRNDEIWLLSHKPVFTQGQAGKEEHILNPGNIPVVHIDRGGQVTYDAYHYIDRVEGHQLQITNTDQSRSYAAIYLHESRLYIVEATVAPDLPPPGMFQQSLEFIDEVGERIRYRDFSDATKVSGAPIRGAEQGNNE